MNNNKNLRNDIQYNTGRTIWGIIVLSFVMFIVTLAGCASKSPQSVVKKWYRGNTHTHARLSDKNDKDDVPEIAGWYRKAGYDFLLLSEHNNHLEKKKIICHDELSEPGKFLMLCGLELSNKRHITALGIESYIGEEKSLQDGVNRTIKAGGLPILNHPQDPKVSAEDFISASGLNHLEIFNGNRPEETPATEVLWDKILSSPAGRSVYAVAADDNHYKEEKAARGWIMVQSPALTKDDIEENIRKGNFYASTGIFLNDYSVKNNTLTIDSKNGSLIVFIGKNGKILSSVNGIKASYTFKDDDLYVRAKITDTDGRAAWTQPVFNKQGTVNKQ
jgi:hypothetical protein